MKSFFYSFKKIRIFYVFMLFQSRPYFTNKQRNTTTIQMRSSMILKSKITALDAVIVRHHLQRVCLLLRRSRAPSRRLDCSCPSCLYLDVTPDAVIVHLQRVCLLSRRLRAPFPFPDWSCPSGRDVALDSVRPHHNLPCVHLLAHPLHMP